MKLIIPMIIIYLDTMNVQHGNVAEIQKIRRRFSRISKLNEYIQSKSMSLSWEK